MIERLNYNAKVIATSNSVQDQKGANSDQTMEGVEKKKEKDQDMKDMMVGMPYNNYTAPNEMAKPLRHQQQPISQQQQQMAQVQQPLGRYQAQKQQFPMSQPLRMSQEKTQYLAQQQPQAQQQNWLLKEQEALNKS